MFTDAVIETQQDQVTGSVHAISRKAEMLVIPVTLNLRDFVTLQSLPLMVPFTVVLVSGVLNYMKWSVNDNAFLHAKPWIPGGEKSIFTVVIH